MLIEFSREELRAIIDVYYMATDSNDLDGLQHDALDKILNHYYDIPVVMYKEEDANSRQEDSQGS
jgi:hypothetical protein